MVATRFTHNCDKCTFGCMSEALMIMHKDRCDQDITEHEERKLIREKMIAEINGNDL